MAKTLFTGCGLPLGSSLQDPPIWLSLQGGLAWMALIPFGTPRHRRGVSSSFGLCAGEDAGRRIACSGVDWITLRDARFVTRNRRLLIICCWVASWLERFRRASLPGGARRDGSRPSLPLLLTGGVGWLRARSELMSPLVLRSCFGRFGSTETAWFSMGLDLAQERSSPTSIRSLGFGVWLGYS